MSIISKVTTEFQYKLSQLRDTLLPKVRETEEIPSLSTFKESSTGVDWLKHKEKLEISKQYTVVPAYNKGPYMVVPVEELHTAGKKGIKGTTDQFRIQIVGCWYHKFLHRHSFLVYNILIL